MRDTKSTGSEPGPICFVDSSASGSKKHYSPSIFTACVPLLLNNANNIKAVDIYSVLPEEKSLAPPKQTAECQYTIFELKDNDQDYPKGEKRDLSSR